MHKRLVVAVMVERVERPALYKDSRRGRHAKRRDLSGLFRCLEETERSGVLYNHNGTILLGKWGP